MKNKHPFHLVNPSISPIFAAFATFFLLTSLVGYMHHIKFANIFLSIGGFLLIFSAYHWWGEIIKEAIIDKAHNQFVRTGLRFGMGFFILSEIAFFFAFFFSFLYSKFFPLGILDDSGWVKAVGSFPLKTIHTLNPWDIPLMNTVILLLSGTTVTWAHYALLENKQKDMVRALTITVMLGLLFSFFQIYEYHHAAFGLKDTSYAANFYLATGFHGAHVMIGTIFLFICLIRARKGHFVAGNNHTGFEFAAWYWHFVDVIWLLLFFVIYVGGRM